MRIIQHAVKSWKGRFSAWAAKSTPGPGRALFSVVPLAGRDNKGVSLQLVNKPVYGVYPSALPAAKIAFELFRLAYALSLPALNVPNKGVDTLQRFFVLRLPIIVNSFLLLFDWAWGTEGVFFIFVK